jgi:cytochrome b6-f complex iron-sulfur subunit
MMKPSLSRRDFITLSTRALLGAGALLGLGGLIRFFSYEPDQGPPSVFDLGDESNFPKGSRTFRDDIPAIIINRNGKIAAYSLTCTHLGCTVEEDKTGKGFTCPCHGSAFDADGKVLNGPAQNPLKELRVEITDENKLMVYTE